MPPLNLRLAVVQFSPKIGQIQANLAKARELCRNINPRSVDLVCFPEMAFTGYVFENSSAIAPYLEKPRSGATSKFCSELAKYLQCYVIAGYPEKLADEELELENASAPREPEDNDKPTDRKEVGANSAVLHGPEGEWVGGYRKTNLFETDMTWAKKGTGFATFELPKPLQTMSIGICMDLNPESPIPWTVADGPYEIANYCLSKNTNLLVLLNAWLDSGKEPEDKHDWSVLNYWAARLRPMWDKDGSSSPDASDEDDAESDSTEQLGKETIVIVCNRSGDENGKTFAGSSAIFSMRRGCGRPKLLDMMERREEGIRIWNIAI